MIPRSLAQARADFVRRFEWDYWVTLTYEQPISLTAATAHFRGWCRVAATDVFKSHLRVICVGDLQKRGVPHYHALIGVVDSRGLCIPAKNAERALRQAWLDGDSRAGFARIARYAPHRGAPWYLAQHGGEWFIAEFCSRSPLCRRQRCRKVAWLLVDGSIRLRVEAVGRMA